MARFMLSGTYSPAGLAGTLEAGLSTRTEIVSKAVASLGGTLVGMYWTTSVHDTLLIVDFPDATGPVALVTQVKAAGAATVESIVRLYDGPEFDAVAKATSAMPYSPPSVSAK
jgi:uncharacterized protein with GYD domain